MRKIKVYKAFHAYSKYIDTFYQKNEILKYSSFEKQKNALIDDGFPWIFSLSSFSKNENFENFEIFETVHNCEYLQKAWSSKHKNNIDWQFLIVLEQIKNFQPDICIIYPPALFNEERINTIRDTIKHDVLIGGYDGMDRQDIELYKGCDFIITCSEYISAFYRSKGINSYTLNFSFDERVLSKIESNSKYKYGIGFSGSIYPNIHNRRYELLKEITKKQKVEIRTDFANNINYRLYSKNQLKRLFLNYDIENYFGIWRVCRKNLGPVFGIEMFQFVRNCKVSLNMHGDRINFAANARMFEITGIGSCLLTDWKENIQEIFEPEKEIIIYTNVEEACDKTAFLLRNEKVRRKIAIEGQKRTLKDYTIAKTIPKLFDFLVSIS